MNSSPWFVRPPQSADAAALTAIATPHLIRQTMAQTNGRFWTLTHHAQPIGYAALLPLPGLPHLFELTGGILPALRRQGAGSFLWQALRRNLMGTAVQHITHTVDSLKSPAACFLQHHGFALEHEEWTMTLDKLPAATFTPPTRPGQLRRMDRAAAVRTLPALYERCFAPTAWFQPYSAAEVSATWQPADSLIGTTARGRNYVRITVENKGGLIMPLQLDLTFEDGTTQRVKLNADIWRRNELQYIYGLFTDKAVVRVVVDPDEVLADVNRENNTWSRGPAAAS